MSIRVAKQHEALSPCLSSRDSDTEVPIARRLTQGVEQAPEGVVIPISIARGTQVYAVSTGKANDGSIASATLGDDGTRQSIGPVHKTPICSKDRYLFIKHREERLRCSCSGATS